MTATQELEQYIAAIRDEARADILRQIEDRVDHWVHAATWFPENVHKTTVLDGLKEAREIVKEGDG